MKKELNISIRGKVIWTGTSIKDFNLDIGTLFFWKNKVKKVIVYLFTT